MRNCRRRLPVRPEAGLTLVEIIVVLTILIVLVTMLTKNLFSVGAGAKASMNQIQMSKVQSYINNFQFRYNRLPSALSVLANCDDTPGCIPMCSENELLDVWGTPYRYRVEGGGRSYVLQSLGADTREGGSGVDADITVQGP